MYGIIKNNKKQSLISGEWFKRKILKDITPCQTVRVNHHRESVCSKTFCFKQRLARLSGRKKCPSNNNWKWKKLLFFFLKKGRSLKRITQRNVGSLISLISVITGCYFKREFQPSQEALNVI